MGVNREKPHIYVLPEDDATRQIANGFLEGPNINVPRIQVMPPSGGWKKVVKKFKDSYAPDMPKYPQRRVILLIDFDEKTGRLDRLATVQKEIPPDLMDRVFVLGVLSEPEKLRNALRKHFSEIGKKLATNCSEGKYDLWEHELLKHNKTGSLGLKVVYNIM